MEPISYKHKTTKMFEELSHKPFIGILSGLGSGLCLAIQNVFTDEKMLKLVGAVGVWGGAIVAGLTAVLKLIELIEKIITKFRKRKNEKNNAQN